MRCSVHYSRTYSLVMLIGMVCFGAVLFVSRSRLPDVVLVAFGIVLCIVITALLGSIVLRKQVLVIDETGIIYNRGRFPKIEWQDVISVERLDRVQRLPNGESHTFIREAWRPIRLLVRCARSDSAKITIEFMGLDADSAKVYDCIQSYLHKTAGKEQIRA